MGRCPVQAAPAHPVAPARPAPATPRAEGAARPIRASFPSVVADETREAQAPPCPGAGAAPLDTPHRGRLRVAVPREAPPPTQKQRGKRGPRLVPEGSSRPRRRPQRLKEKLRELRRRVGLTCDLPDGSLSAGDVLEFIYRDGRVYVVALLSTDSAPDSRNSDRTHRARQLFTCLLEPDIKQLFPDQERWARTPNARRCCPPPCISASSSTAAPAAPGVDSLICLCKPRARACRHDAPGLLRVYRPIGSPGVRLGSYHRELGGVTVYQA